MLDEIHIMCHGQQFTSTEKGTVQMIQSKLETTWKHRCHGGSREPLDDKGGVLWHTGDMGVH